MADRLSRRGHGFQRSFFNHGRSRAKPDRPGGQEVISMLQSNRCDARKRGAKVEPMRSASVPAPLALLPRPGGLRRLVKRAHRSRYLLLLLAPTMLYYLIFHYGAMYGIIIAFREFVPGRGMFGGTWAGTKYFELFFGSYYFWRILRNTVILSLLTILCNTPVPIIFAILLNEMRDRFPKRFVQTVSYFPHFISMVIVIGIVKTFVSPVDGVINNILRALGREPINFLIEQGWFRPIYLISGVWQDFGWSSIIYLATLTGISPELFEAASIEGANRLQRIIHITLPGLLPTIMILFILDMGSVMNVGFEKVYLLYNPTVYETADVISTFTYRAGITQGQFSYATAVGLFNSVANFAVLLFVNWLSRRVTEHSLW
jgi:putative aldouronate transport system permease protein